MPGYPNIFLLVSQLGAFCKLNLLFYKINVGYHFCDAVLNLYSCVHLNEIKISAFVQQKFDSAGSLIPNCHNSFYSSASHCFS